MNNKKTNMRHLSSPVVLIDFYNLGLNVVTGLDSLSSHTLCLNSRVEGNQQETLDIVFEKSLFFTYLSCI